MTNHDDAAKSALPATAGSTKAADRPAEGHRTRAAAEARQAPDHVMLLESNNGARYQIGQWPKDKPYAFGDDPAPVFRTKEKETFDHDADGHKHDGDPACRACG